MRISGAAFVNPLHSAQAMQNSKMVQMVQQINAKVHQRRNFDVVDISDKLKKMVKQEQAKKEETPKIIYENSPMVGKYSQAEWAERTLSYRRDSLYSMASCLENEKQKVMQAVEKIEEYEKTAAGDFSKEDLDWITWHEKHGASDVNWVEQRKEQGAQLATKYKDVIAKGVTDLVTNQNKMYNSWMEAYDDYSGGLASRVDSTLLDDVTVKGLGLDNLSQNPKEIIAAIDKAEELLVERALKTQAAFEQASGKAMRANNISLESDPSKIVDYDWIINDKKIYDFTKATLGESIKIDLPK